jgi:hypothetical protein
MDEERVMKLNKVSQKCIVAVVAFATLMASAAVALAGPPPAIPPGPKVQICHKGMTKTVPLVAAENGHRTHGDTLGPCTETDGGVCACPFIFLPVICSNGVTYPSQCVANCDGQSPANCQLAPPFNTCACDLTFEPVTCDNGVTYANQCFATCNGQGPNECKSAVQPPATCVDGSPAACDFVFLPVMCSDGNTYANQCIATCVTGLTNCPLAPPFNMCACDLTFEPVTCPNGTTYANPCLAACDGQNPAQCTPAFQPPATCLDGSVAACDFTYIPVLCSDKNIYANQCVATCVSGLGPNMCIEVNGGNCVDGSPAACDFTYIPVTCSNGVTYANLCIATCLGATGCM